MTKQFLSLLLMILIMVTPSFALQIEVSEKTELMPYEDGDPYVINKGEIFNTITDNTYKKNKMICYLINYMGKAWFIPVDSTRSYIPGAPTDGYFEGCSLNELQNEEELGKIGTYVVRSDTCIYSQPIEKEAYSLETISKYRHVTLFTDTEVEINGRSWIIAKTDRFIGWFEKSALEIKNEGLNRNQSTQQNTKPSSGDKNALQRAYQYLEYSPFSKKGLKEQLEFEGYLSSEADYAVNHCGADWNEQAYLKAQQYLDYSSFSKSGLIEQLEFVGFTTSQAIYGVNKAYQ